MIKQRMFPALWLVLATAVFVIFAASCSITANAPTQPDATVKATDAMAKPTDGMVKPTDAMAKATDAMVKPTDAMVKPTDAMAKTDTMPKLPDMLVAPHFVESNPKHGEVLNKVPEKVELDFNFTLHELSSITVEKDGTPVEVGETVLGDKKLKMTAMLPMTAGDGLYLVKYKACWPDQSCHNGQFAFQVAAK